MDQEDDKQKVRLGREAYAAASSLFVCAFVYLIFRLAGGINTIQTTAPWLYSFIATNHPQIFFILTASILYLVLRSMPIKRNEVRSLKQRLIAHTSHTPLATVVWDRDFRVVEWNATAERIFGFTREEAIGRLGSDLVIPQELLPSIDGIFSDLVSGVGGFRSTNENITKEGRRILCDWYNTPLKNERGEIIAIASSALDVTDRLKMAHDEQARLRQVQEEQAALVYMASHPSVIEGRFDEAIQVVTETAAKILKVERCGIWLLSPDNSKIECSDLYENGNKLHSSGIILKATDYPRYFAALTFGRAVDAGDAISDPRTSEFAEVYLKPHGITSMLDAAIRVRGKVVGTVCNEHVGPRRDWTASEIAFAGEVADQVAQALIVREREDALLALRQSEEMFRQLTENIHGVFWLSSPDKKIAYYISPAFEEIWGRSCDYYYENPIDWLETVHPQDLKRVEGTLPSQGSGHYDIEFRIMRPDGEERWVRDRAFPIRDNSGSVFRIAGICEDITARKKAEEAQSLMEQQLRQTQKMEALGSLAGGIAHDFNNILSSIIGYAELLKDELAHSEDKSNYCDAVLTGANRAKGLVKQILTFTRQSDTRNEIVDVSTIIDDVVKLLRVSLPPGIIISTRIDSESKILADPIQLYQVVMNLCTNAIYSMRERGGTLSISTERWTEIHSGGDRRFVKLSVLDSGKGIPTKLKDRIFDPFFTTKPIGEGTGLGLSVVHGVVKSLGGRIDVESEEGKGSEFILFLPLFEGHEVSPASQTGQRTVTGSEHILFVDDEEMVTQLVKEILSRNGYQVTVTQDANLAIEWLKSGLRCELLISDLTMPTMNGIVLIRRAQELRPGLKSILCTGYDPTATSSDKEVGISARLSKPFSIQDLLTTVRKVLGNNERVGSLRAVG